MPDRLIRATTAVAVLTVAVVAAVISYRHAYELVHSHGESGVTARLVPFTVDGLIWAASMVILDASRRKHPAPPLAKWSLAVGIVATVGANVAHGASHGPIGAAVSAWPALALVGSFELLMTLTRETAPPLTPTPPIRHTSPRRAPGSGSAGSAAPLSVGCVAGMVLRPPALSGVPVGAGIGSVGLWCEVGCGTSGRCVSGARWLA